MNLFIEPSSSQCGKFSIFQATESPTKEFCQTAADVQALNAHSTFKANLSLPLTLTFPLLLLLLLLLLACLFDFCCYFCCACRMLLLLLLSGTPRPEVVQSVYMHTRSAAEGKDDLRNSFGPFH